MKWPYLPLVDDERDQQARFAMAPLITKVSYPYVDDDKAGPRQLLSYAIIKGGNKFAPETRSVH